MHCSLQSITNHFLLKILIGHLRSYFQGSLNFILMYHKCNFEVLLCHEFEVEVLPFKIRYSNVYSIFNNLAKYDQ